MMENKIERRLLVEKLLRFRDKQLVKVVTGIRRCGKSTLLGMFRETLRRDGVSDDRIQDYNFEELALEPLMEYHKLHSAVESRLRPDVMNYVFFDEIQNVPMFEKAVNSLLAKGNVDVYITGSNAHMLSGELATRLSGRTVEIHVTPLSFSETFGRDADAKAFQSYMGGTAFPYARRLQSRSDVYDYLELLRRGYAVFVGKVGASEIDFVAPRDGLTMYVQVSLSVLDENTKRRELAPLEAVGDSFPKFVLTLDPLPATTHKGIVIGNAVDWLAGRDA